MKRLSVLTIIMIEGICTFAYASNLSARFKTPPDSARPGFMERNLVVSTNLGLVGEEAGDAPATDGQIGYLKRLRADIPAGLTVGQASALIDRMEAKEQETVEVVKIPARIPSNAAGREGW